MWENNLQSNLSTKWNARAGNAFIQWLSSLFCRLCLIRECVLNSLCGRLGCITLSMPRRFSPPFIPPNHQEEIPNPHSNSDQVPVWVQVLHFLFFPFSFGAAHLYFTCTSFVLFIGIAGFILVLLLREVETGNKTDFIFWIFIAIFMFSSDSR